MRKTASILVLFIVFAACMLGLPITAQNQSEHPAGTALVFKGKRLAAFYATIGGQTPDMRAARAGEILHRLSLDPHFNVNSISTVETATGTDIVAGHTVIATVSSEDARIAASSTTDMAREFAAGIRLALAERIEETTAAGTAIGIGITIIAFIALLLIIVFLGRITSQLCSKIESWQGTRIKSIRIQQAELIGAKALSELLLSIVKFAQIAVLLLACGSFILLALSSFPATRATADALLANAAAPVMSMGEHILKSVPSIVMIVVIAFITYGVTSFSRFVFHALGEGTIRLVDFDPDWAEPTYKLWRFLIFCIAVMVALPYLPGWDSPAFKQVGLMLGILVSLGSTGVVANVLAGAVLTYTNAFKVGDRVKICDCTGDVLEKTLFVTRLRTPKNEVVSLPNQQVISSNVVNFSTLAKQGQLTLYTTVTIGYDAPWRKVHELLLEAARCTSEVVADPEPFVLQTALNDFYVSYELNVFSEQANNIPKIYSELHKNIQDKFNEGGVEIMSPHYTSLRDGNHTTIPASYLPKEYSAAGFKVG